ADGFVDVKHKNGGISYADQNFRRLLSNRVLKGFQFCLWVETIRAYKLCLHPEVVGSVHESRLRLLPIEQLHIIGDKEVFFVRIMTPTTEDGEHCRENQQSG